METDLSAFIWFAGDHDPMNYDALALETVALTANCPSVCVRNCRGLTR